MSAMFCRDDPTHFSFQIIIPETGVSFTYLIKKKLKETLAKLDANLGLINNQKNLQNQYQEPMAYRLYLLNLKIYSHS